MRNKSVLDERDEIQTAAELITLGARLQVLETETSLSRERLIKLYKEIKGCSPSKGMLPFSEDWYLGWEPNVHASLFLDIHRYLQQHTGARGVGALIKSYKLYLEHVAASQLDPVLTLTRAWTLLRFFGSLLKSVRCTRCSGSFIGHPLTATRGYVCGLCKPPSRAGKSRRMLAAYSEQAVPAG